MAPEEISNSTEVFDFKLKLARLMLTAFCLLQIMLIEDLFIMPTQAIAGTFGLYFIVALVLNFFPLINSLKVRRAILCLDGLALGAICWLTASILFSIEALGLIMISAAITTRFKSFGTAIFLAAVSATGVWYITPNAGLPALSNWQSGWQIAFCTLALIIYAITFLHQQSLKISEASGALTSAEAQQLELKFKLYQVSKYMSPTLRKKLSRPREIEAKTVRKRLTIFFSDLVGFTKMSEDMDPSDLNYILNSYVTEMSNVAIEYGATIDKFMGDGMMAFFGDPKSLGTKEDAVQCVNMAMEMQRRMPKLRAEWREQGINADLHIRMGINSGFTTVGNFGSNDRLDYTALGSEVNLASRLESNAEVDSIYVSSSTHIMIHEKYECESRGEISVKGFADPVPVFKVIKARGSSKDDRTFANHTFEGFSLYMDLENMPNYNHKKVHEALVDAAEKLKNHRAKEARK